jgi:hypothetical protein
MSKSLYAKYVHEKYGQECLESDHSFMVYKVDGTVCTVELAFTEREHRRSGEALKLMKQLTKSLPPTVKYLSCEVDTAAHDGQESYRACRTFGFEPLKTRANNIVMVKYL